MSFDLTPFERPNNSPKELTEFEIFEGMNQVNCEMANKIEEKMKKEQPICHFTKMNYQEGFWICEHCGHEVESEVAPFEEDYCSY